MNLLSVVHWLEAPANHAIIARRTRPGAHELRLPPPDDPQRFAFLVLGDTGDSDVTGTSESPQDAVARVLADEAGMPGHGRDAALVLHLGDVVYMTGERRLYDRNFRRPYAPFLAPDSTYEHLVFRMPFLPVPGNHDYYDFPRWARWVARTPLLGPGARALARELFAFSLPAGGSDAGGTFMDAFVARDGDGGPLAYVPGRDTRVPNRYYRFSCGDVDFFALDSNTLDAFPPEVGASQVRASAARELAGLEQQADVIAAELGVAESAHESSRDHERHAMAVDPARRAAAMQAAHVTTDALQALAQVLAGTGHVPGARTASAEVEAAARGWRRHGRALAEANGAAFLRALTALDQDGARASDAGHAIDEVLVHLPEGEPRTRLMGARDALAAAIEAWRTASCDRPDATAGRIARLTDERLDVERALARARLRRGYDASDYDAAQLQWLEQALEDSIRRRPHAWRIVYLHHPLWTSITSYSETGEIHEIRDNLSPRLAGRVHAVFCGHAHAFEWLRIRALPGTGVFVSGGGGQVRLGRSVLDPARGDPIRARRLAAAGVDELAYAGRGPDAEDGRRGRLYHVLRVEVSPDTLRVAPIGVRRLRHGYRREQPMPVWHASSLLTPWRARPLRWIELRRGAEPVACWA